MKSDTWMYLRDFTMSNQLSGALYIPVYPIVKCMCVCFFFFFLFFVWTCVQPPLGRAFFFFQYDIDFLYDFIRLIPALPPSTLAQSHTHSHTQMPIMPAFPPSNQSRQLVFGSMASMSRLSTLEMENGPFRKAEHIT